MGLPLRDRSAKGCLRSLKGECWIDREISGCEFRDARLGDRFRKLLTQIGSAMGQSIPLVCQDWANTKAAYRFFSNDRVSEADILAGHFQLTRDRAAAAEGLILVLHDTTEFSYQRENSETLAGPEAMTFLRIVTRTASSQCEGLAPLHLPLEA